MSRAPLSLRSFGALSASSWRPVSLVVSFVALCALGGTTACSGSDASVPEGGGPGDDAGLVPVDGAVRGSEGGRDGASGEASSPGDGGVDMPIDPIATGYSWTYDVTILGTYPLCKAGSATGSVTGNAATGGRDAFQVKSFCAGFGTSSYSVTGDKVELFYQNAWVLVVDAPVTAGHTWSNGVTSFQWEDAGKVSVPAGTFDNCFKAKATVGASYTTFCRGVGPVHWHYVDGSGNGYDAVLTSKSF